jgi:hypothetical protein
MTYQLRIAALDDEAVKKLEKLEAETGHHVMAYEPGLQFATLTAADLVKIRALEEELGVILLVYKE